MLENFASGKSYNRTDSVGQIKYHDRVKNTNPLLLSKADRIILDYQGQVPHYERVLSKSLEKVKPKRDLGG